MAAAAATDALSRFFGFAQFDLAGSIDVADGRYLTRDEAGDEQGVLVVEALATAPLPGRRRRRPQPVGDGGAPAALPLTRVTAIRAAHPLGDTAEGQRWLEAALADDEAVDAVVGDGISLLNRVLFAQAVAAAEPVMRELGPADPAAVRIGYGSGEEVAAGRFTVARLVDVRAHGLSRRRQRSDELRPQERLAALLAGREQIDACELPLLRARADVDAGRWREATLQVRAGAEAVLAELTDAVGDPGHERDIAHLGERRAELGRAASSAAAGELGAEERALVADLLETCERVLRRRRVLSGR